MGEVLKTHESGTKFTIKSLQPLYNLEEETDAVLYHHSSKVQSAHHCLVEADQMLPFCVGSNTMSMRVKSNIWTKEMGEVFRAVSHATLYTASLRLEGGGGCGEIVM